MIEFDNVSKVFNGGTKAVNDVSFKVKEGEIFVLIGPSGCGKTTTLKMINRLIDSSEGTIRVHNKNIQDMNIKKLRWNIGYVLQQIALFPHMTIKENIAVVPELIKWPQEKIDKRVDELLEMVGLDPGTYRDRKPDELSGGQQQRIGVVRALAGDPDIILMDEPFSALDPISREQLQEDIKKLQEEIKKTVVFVTHDIEEALKLGHHICLMKDGKVVQIGSPAELLENPADEFVKEFLGDRKDPWAEKVSSLLPEEAPAENNDIRRPKVSYEATVREALEQLKHSSENSVAVYEGETYKGDVGYKEITLYMERKQSTLKGGSSL
ncbi:ABC transporter ATP-binding protein [Salipaludibacillus sp. CUR1]|uniref:ABC transporter ATP-binding protein n=1 Tax=Salipaludibacillus sp. CUR1 TaxID=2820003 RepID=UPI001E33160F|nr:ABC transporter ATP-binding protein [Salipaludibacillus sp. CUR1]MCE7792339.1 ABC transporter ATP-binding protein [Salipaludibacillus sp. CUR1]